MNPPIIFPRIQHIDLTRETFAGLLQYNTAIGKHTLIKITATWCGPCKQIKQYAHAKANDLPSSIEVYEVDVDESPDFYAFMKSKRMVNGIPVFLLFHAGNMTYIPTDSVTGASTSTLDLFFARCMTL